MVGESNETMPIIRRELRCNPLLVVFLESFVAGPLASFYGKSSPLVSKC